MTLSREKYCSFSLGHSVDKVGKVHENKGTLQYRAEGYFPL
ncbi:hypothetical protein HMPREF6123_2484 [Oribacterium sinus F0268]|uniref:Uncharacterized protein n=1 Tax=Oribacterium sinus F0268 TaxID=585501 RepID=C2L165_9FIRM|nr:hypothetical protein HMPREF6123_2484 [Oribacterium sinus F0268]